MSIGSACISGFCLSQPEVMRPRRAWSLMYRTAEIYYVGAGCSSNRPGSLAFGHGRQLCRSIDRRSAGLALKQCRNAQGVHVTEIEKCNRLRATASAQWPVHAEKIAA